VLAAPCPAPTSPRRHEDWTDSEPASCRGAPQRFQIQKPRTPRAQRGHILPFLCTPDASKRAALNVPAGAAQLLELGCGFLVGLPQISMGLARARFEILRSGG